MVWQVVIWCRDIGSVAYCIVCVKGIRGRGFGVGIFSLWTTSSSLGGDGGLER